MRTLISGSVLDHPALQRISAEGYSITYARRTDCRILDLHAWYRGNYAGFAIARFDEAAGTFFIENITVSEPCRGHGLANAMMVCAMALTGCTPVPAVGQTDDGRAWWVQLNRPW